MSLIQVGLMISPSRLSNLTLSHHHHCRDQSYESFTTHHGPLHIIHTTHIYLISHTHMHNTPYHTTPILTGTYALIGAAAILGGMARMTIAGCVIVLEACGNTTYLLPLMVTFAAARYAGMCIHSCNV
ncbi:hypothetical protein EON63_05860 [archaeon]|nr:MAG: hypothetical protein EON63_05860 [archaeon]